MFFRNGCAAPFCFVCVGCANTGASTGAISPIQQQADDFKVTVAQGAAVGALLGGVTGAIIGGGDTSKIVTGALAGAAGGAMGSYIIAGQKQTYASQEDALNSVIADSTARSQKLTQLVQTTDSVIAVRKQKLVELNASATAVKEKQKQKELLLSELKADQRALDDALDSAGKHQTMMNENIAELRRQFPTGDMSRLE